MTSGFRVYILPLRRRAMGKRTPAARLAQCLRLLLKRYGRKHRSPAETLLEHVLFYHLHTRISFGGAKRLIKILRERFADMNEVRVTPRQELAAVCEEARLSSEAVDVIKWVLRSIFREENDLRLRGVELADDDELVRRITKWDCVDGSVADYVLMQWRGARVLALDPLGGRVLERFGVSPSVARSKEALDWKKRRLALEPYQAFALLLEHARRFCKDDPLCGNCPLTEHCAYRKRRRRR